MELIRCSWCTQDPLYIHYHDHEWGIPLHDDAKLFELLCLESMQAGLNWFTILKKREHFRQAFDKFSAKKIQYYDEQKIIELLNNENIIRNRSKITAIIHNAKIFLELQHKYQSFDHYLWQFTEGKTIHNAWQNHKQIPTSTSLSDKIAKDLKQYGFKFIGTTTCYAFLQACGIINDHLVSCFCYEKIYK